MYRVGKLNERNEVPVPLLPLSGQNVASWRNVDVPSIGSRRSAKLKCRRKKPGNPRASNDTHELLASPRRTMNVASVLSNVELLDEITEVTPRKFWCRMYRSVK